MDTDKLTFILGDMCNVQQVDIMDAMEEKHQGWGLDYINERLHLITLKNT